jgi:hypothetical protein
MNGSRAIVLATELSRDTGTFAPYKWEANALGASLGNIFDPPIFRQAPGWVKVVPDVEPAGEQPTLEGTDTLIETEFPKQRLMAAPLPLERPVAPQFVPLQTWEGVVESVGGESFRARLRDLKRGDAAATEIAEIPRDLVADDDIPLLAEGGVFYLNVGRRTVSNGRQERATQVVFRRLPAWTKSTIDSAMKRAEELTEFFSESGADIQSTAG